MLISVALMALFISRDADAVWAGVALWGGSWNL